MKHLGDITKIDWSKVEPVDCVCGGSPCQDLSVAGKRAGLAGERSGLYMEQIRCVKELREADVRRGRTGQFIRPRYMVWENVPGAFSSGKTKGADFAAVIEEIIKVAEQDAYVCVMPPSSGWTKSGCYYDRDGRWSVAWRIHDAQFWGVPQRRKRISLVADFGGLSAPEILFERKGLRRDSQESGEERESTSPNAERGIGADDRTRANGADLYNLAVTGDVVCSLTAGGNTSTGTSPKVLIPYTLEPGIAAREGGHIYEGISGSLRANAGDNQMAVAYVHNLVLDDQGGQQINVRTDDKCPTLRAEAHGNVPAVIAVATQQGGAEISENGVCPTITAAAGMSGNNQPWICKPMPQLYENHSQDSRYKGPLDVCPMLPSQLGTGGNNTPFVVEPITAEVYAVGNGQVDQTKLSPLVGALNCMHDQQAVLIATGDCNDAYQTKYIVRRLTPLECERLQGYPDGWTDIGEWVDSKGKKRKDADSPRYKALGNSIALPFWKWMLKRISAQYERDATLGSLFDGIGGFPLCWEQINGKGAARWASEIEEFPMAVTRLRFGEE